jgi:hypothetical protein
MPAVEEARHSHHLEEAVGEVYPRYCCPLLIDSFQLKERPAYSLDGNLLVNYGPIFSKDDAWN